MRRGRPISSSSCLRLGLLLSNYRGTPAILSAACGGGFALPERPPHEQILMRRRPSAAAADGHRPQEVAQTESFPLAAFLVLSPERQLLFHELSRREFRSQTRA